MQAGFALRLVDLSVSPPTQAMDEQGYCVFQAVLEGTPATVRGTVTLSPFSLFFQPDSPADKAGPLPLLLDVPGQTAVSLQKHKVPSHACLTLLKKRPPDGADSNLLIPPPNSPPAVAARGRGRGPLRFAFAGRMRRYFPVPLNNPSDT